MLGKSFRKKEIKPYHKKLVDLYRLAANQDKENAWTAEKILSGTTVLCKYDYSYT